jgi:spore coat polysaccharide biosynthesis protein SpsF
MPLNKIAIIQARMSSSRLPGKVMLDIAGKPMLQHVIDRTRQAQSVDRLVLATTTDPSDDILEEFCQKQALPCYRGSLPDALDRFYQAAHLYQADVIIRLTADCPLIDPAIIDRTVTTFSNPPSHNQWPDLQLPDPFPLDFTANRLPPPWKRTLPIGLDVEVCSSAALARAWREADQLYQREHVMPYLYEGVIFPPRESAKEGWYVEQGSTPRGVKVALLNHAPDYGSLRWTVDTPPDLEFVRQVYYHFGGQANFDWKQILRLVEQMPELVNINADVKHKSAFDAEKPAQDR